MYAGIPNDLFFSFLGFGIRISETGDGVYVPSLMEFEILVILSFLIPLILSRVVPGGFVVAPFVERVFPNFVGSVMRTPGSATQLIKFDRSGSQLCWQQFLFLLCIVNVLNRYKDLGSSPIL